MAKTSKKKKGTKTKKTTGSKAGAKKTKTRTTKTKKTETKRKEKIKVTNELKRNWFGARNAWEKSMFSFGSYISRIKDDEALKLMKFSKTALFKDSYVEILNEHPEFKGIVRSDRDRGCMLDIYTNLSARFRDYSSVESLSRLEKLKLRKMGYNV